MTTNPGSRGSEGDKPESTSYFRPDFGDVAATDESSVAADAVEVRIPAGSALLVVKRGPIAGSRFLLDTDSTSVGRHPDSDIFLDDITVSRRHAEFSRSGDEFRVRDVGSLNGTYVNRHPTDEAVLSSGDEVQIGKFRLTFLTS